jgi:hypothetical protein
MIDLNHLAHWREVYLSAKAAEAEAKALAQQAKDELLGALGDTETVGMIDDKVAVSREDVKRTALSQSLLKRLHPDVAAECMETTTITKVVIK